MEPAKKEVQRLSAAPGKDMPAAEAAAEDHRRVHARPGGAALAGLFLLAVLYTCYFAKPILLPVTAAALLSLVFMPLVRRLAGWRIPPAMTAALVITTLLAGLMVGVYALAEPVSTWRDRLPTLTEELSYKLRGLREPVERVQEASRQVERMADVDDEPESQEVVVKEPSLLNRIASGVQAVGIQLSLTVILLFFLLAYGDLFKEKLIKIMPTFRDKKRALVITRQVERQVSTYFATITLINLGLGACIGAAFYAVGMPNAMLWGAMAALLNFMPYLGLLIGATCVAIVGVVTFDTLVEGLVPAAIYLGFNAIEANFVTPSVLGRRFTMNPVLVFVAIVFWGWLWGVAGALLAVPLLVVVKALSENVEALEEVGEFLRGRES